MKRFAGEDTADEKDRRFGSCSGAASGGLDELLEYYFMVIDPLSVNQQGNDRGVQYRTGIYYTDEAQLPQIREVYDQQERKAGAKLAVELEPLRNFFTAEEYHQDYLDKNPGGYCHIPAEMFSLENK